MFDNYLKKLAIHEGKKYLNELDTRGKIVVNSGIGLNWIGDFLGNPKVKFKKLSIPLEDILFTGTNPRWNKILLKDCGKSIRKFQELVKKDKNIKKEFESEASYGREPILVRYDQATKKYKVFDGMHRFIGAVLSGKKKIQALTPVNDEKYLPVCEAHVVYDIIRGYQRNAKDKVGERQLYYALKLLARSYSNVKSLLRKRFNYKYIPDKTVQNIIKRVVSEQ